MRGKDVQEEGGEFLRPSWGFFFGPGSSPSWMSGALWAAALGKTEVNAHPKVTEGIQLARFLLGCVFPAISPTEAPLCFGGAPLRGAWRIHGFSLSSQQLHDVPMLPLTCTDESFKKNHEFGGIITSLGHTTIPGGHMETPAPLPLPASVGCFALGTPSLELCSGEAKIKPVIPSPTENRAFLLHPCVLDGHQKPNPGCSVPCGKTIFYSDPPSTAARPGRDVQFPAWRSGDSGMGFLPGNGKHKHKQPLSLQLIALNKSLFCSRGVGGKQKLIHG